MGRATLVLALVLALLAAALSLPISAAAQPVVLSGVGQSATRPVEIPFAIPVATFTHDGSSNFIVYAFQGGQEVGLVANEIGNVQVRGLIELISDEPVTFDVSADGAWTISIDEISSAGGPEFNGTNNDVSGRFAAPEDGPWEFSNNGDSNFIVYLHCDGGRDLAVNEIGPISGSTVVNFTGDSCFWEVEAEGAWSLSPRRAESPSVSTPAPTAASSQQPIPAVQATVGTAPTSEVAAATQLPAVPVAGFGPSAFDTNNPYAWLIAALVGAGIAWLTAGLAGLGSTTAEFGSGARQPLTREDRPTIPARSPRRAASPSPPPLAEPPSFVSRSIHRRR